MLNHRIIDMKHLNNKRIEFLVDIISSTPKTYLYALRYLDRFKLGRIQSLQIEKEMFCFMAFIVRKNIQPMGECYEMNNTIERSKELAVKKFVKGKWIRHKSFLGYCNQRVEYWSSFDHIATPQGEGGMLYSFSQNIAGIITGNKYDKLFLLLYSDFLEMYQKIQTLILAGWDNPDSFVEKNYQYKSRTNAFSWEKAIIITLLAIALVIIVLELLTH